MARWRNLAQYLDADDRECAHEVELVEAELGVGLIERGWSEWGAWLRCQWRTAEHRRGCCCARARKKKELVWDRVGHFGGAGWHPYRVKPIGRAAASTMLAYGRHVAGAGWSEAGASARVRGEGEMGRVVERAKWEAGRPSSACPLSFFFEFLFSILFPNSF